MILLIIGLFYTFHFIVKITAYDKYPLQYSNAESRCDSVPTITNDQGESIPDKQRVGDCTKELESDRRNTRIDDIEKSISFTGIGLFVFVIHFYLGRKERKIV